MVNRKYTSRLFIFIALIFVLITSCTPSDNAPAIANAQPLNSYPKPQAVFNQTLAANGIPQAANAQPQSANGISQAAFGQTQVAYAKTQVAYDSTHPNPTQTPTSTYTPTSTDTPTSILTPTETQTPIPTPDVRVINASPQELSLQLSELPADAGYYLPGPSWTSPQLYSELVGQMGADKAKEYLERSGWVYGWEIHYKRGSTAAIAPQEVSDNIMLFTTYNGAVIHFKDYSTCLSDKDFTSIDITLIIGDATTSCIYRKMQPGGENIVVILIEFVYRNIFHQVGGYGSEREVSLDYLQQIAVTLLTRLKAVALSEQVTFKP